MRKRTHPGVFLKKELMKNQKLTNQYLYRDSEVATDYWRSFLRGEASITEDIAYELGDKLNISVDFWFKMQSCYDDSIR